MLWNLQSYSTTVLNERMRHFRSQNILWPSYIISGGQDSHLPGSMLLVHMMNGERSKGKGGLRPPPYSKKPKNRHEIQHTIPSKTTTSVLWHCRLGDRKGIRPVKIPKVSLDDLPWIQSDVEWSPEKGQFIINCVKTISPDCTNLIISSSLTLGYWHQRADERHGNPPPR